MARAFGRPNGELVMATGIRPIFDIDKQPRGQARRLAEDGEQPAGMSWGMSVAGRELADQRQVGTNGREESARR